MVKKQKPTNNTKVVAFINKMVGKELTTTIISNRTGVNIRQVQSFCKGQRVRKDVVTSRQGSSIVYKFTKPI